MNTNLYDKMRRAGFEPALPAWRADVLDQAGRSSQRRMPTIYII